MIYIAIGGLLVIFTLLETDNQFRLLSREGCYLALVLMIGLASMRNGVGTDWDAYLSFYKNTEESSRVEIGYSYFNNFFSNIGLHFNVFLFILTLISVVLISSFLKNMGAMSAAAVLMFYSDLFLYLNLSGMRQALAISITCFSFRYAINHKPLTFFSLVALASSFQMSAAVFFLAYFIPRGRPKWHHFLWITLGMILLFNSLETIAQFITENTLKNAMYYLDGIEVSDNALSNYFIGSLKRVLVLGIMWAAWRDLKERLYFQYTLNVYIFGLLIYLLFYMLSADIGVRMSAYFTIFDTIIIGLVVIYSRHFPTRIGIAVIVSAASIYKLLGYANNPYYEYKFFFQ